MLVLALMIGAAVLPQQWSAGVEREVDEGYYMKVLASDQGWRIWQMESRYGIRCLAIKSAIGRRHPTPIGQGFLMSRDTPFLELDWREDEGVFRYSWGARHFGGLRAKYRAPGARFWEEGASGSFEPGELGEQTIQVVIESFEYPNTGIGRSEETADFDLAGIRWAEGQARACTESVPEERRPFAGMPGGPRPRRTP